MKRHGPAALLVFALTLAVFWPALANDFIEEYDDSQYLTRNAVVRGGLSREGVVWAFTDNRLTGNWHPLTWLSHMLDVTLFGMDPRMHHLVNVLLHAANAGLLFVVLHAATGARGRSALVAALFAVHPLRVESVAWVAERKDLLSALFALLAAGAYLRQVRQPSRGRAAAVAALLLLSLMAKPMFVTLPFVFLLLDVWPLGRIGPSGTGPGPSPWRRARVGRLFAEKWLLFSAAAVFSAIALVSQDRGRALQTLSDVRPMARVGNALTSYAAYLGKLVWPVDLSFFYPLAPGGAGTVATVGALALLLGMSAGVVALGRRHPSLPVGWAWYLGTLVPVIGLVQVGDQALADRYTYFPLIGIVLAVVWGGAEGLARRPGARAAALAAAALALLALAAQTRQQLRFWKNDVTLLSHALAVGPAAPLVHNNLGNALAREGALGPAAEQYRSALRLSPRYAMASYNLGLLLWRQGRREEAISRYREALRAKPDYPDALNNLGNALSATGNLEEAAAVLREAGIRYPGNADLHNNLGLVLKKLGRHEEALAQFGESVRLNPRDNNAQFNLGSALERLGNPGQAADHYRLALALDPGDQEARHRLDRLLQARQGGSPR